MPKSWGVVQSVGHLTVNEDGVGSSPTAPANSLPQTILDVNRIPREKLERAIGGSV
jgi:hypothetical protein